MKSSRADKIKDSVCLGRDEKLRSVVIHFHVEYVRRRIRDATRTNIYKKKSETASTDVRLRSPTAAVGHDCSRILIPAESKGTEERSCKRRATNRIARTHQSLRLRVVQDQRTNGNRKTIVPLLSVGTHLFVLRKYHCKTCQYIKIQIANPRN